MHARPSNETDRTVHIVHERMRNPRNNMREESNSGTNFFSLKLCSWLGNEMKRMLKA